MKKTILCLALLLTSCQSLLKPGQPPGVQSAPAGTHPNVLLLVADDLGVEHFEPYEAQGAGGNYARMPRLESLASQGQIYTRAWATPVCSPTRAELLTGMVPAHTLVGQAVQSEADAGLRLSETTLAELLSPAGYSSGAFGKWHLGVSAPEGGLDAPRAQGFAHAVVTAGNLFPVGESYESWTWIRDGVEEPATGYITTATIDEAMSWIGSQTGPWFAYVAFHAPHSPIACPPRILVSAGESCDAQTETLEVYHQMAEAMDTEIGRLLDSLAGTNTLTLFLSDNGSPDVIALAPVMQGKAKHTVFEGGVRVAFVASGPMVTAGRVTGIVSAADVLPTVAELAGLPSQDVDGRSFASLLTDPGGAAVHQFVRTETWGPNGSPPPADAQVAARDVRWKLLRRNGKEWLLDLSADPLELSPLTPPLNPEQLAARDALRAFLATF